MLHIRCWERTRDIDADKNVTTTRGKEIKGYGDSRKQGFGGDTNLRKSSAHPR